jgi:hypothetical protein
MRTEQKTKAAPADKQGNDIPGGYLPGWIIHPCSSCRTPFRRLSKAKGMAAGYCSACRVEMNTRYKPRRPKIEDINATSIGLRKRMR